MNTDTGRIYGPPELRERYDAFAAGLNIDGHQAEFAKAVDEGKIVPVSDTVAQKMKIGEREFRRRQRRRKARRS